MPEANTFTGATLDRAEDGRRRDSDWVAQQATDPGARALVLTDAGVRIEHDTLHLEAIAEAGEGATAVLLGRDERGPVYAVDGGTPPEPGTRPAFLGAGGRRGEPAPQATGFTGLRDAAQTLGQADSGLIAYAAALLNWHRFNRFCPNCATATDVVEAGVTRSCPRCGLQQHPRIDPVVIMLVTDGDRVLLGRQAVWPPKRYSALAGFVAAGESLEEAVKREVAEEAGVRVGNPVFHSSQPWPFPASLMLGFLVPYEGGEIGGSDSELEDARWFGRDEVAESTRENSWADPGDGLDLLLPPRSAIARRLVEAWIADH